MRLPALSVSRSPVQETRVWSCTPPPLITRPLRVEEAVVVLIRVVLIPPANVEVAVEVEVIEPVVNAPVVRSEKMPEVDLKIEAKRLVVVAFVPVALVNVRFWNVEDAVAKKFWAVILPSTSASPLT